MPDPNKRMSIEKKNMVKKILINIQKHFQNQNQFLERSIKNIDVKEDIKEIKEITNHPKIGRIFIEQINQYTAWSQAFKTLAKERQKEKGKEDLKPREFDEFLLTLQNKIKIDVNDEGQQVTHKSYLTHILINKGKLGLDKELVNELKQKKEEEKKKKAQKQKQQKKTRKEEETKKQQIKKMDIKMQDSFQIPKPTKNQPKEVKKQDYKKDQGIKFPIKKARQISIFMEQYLSTRDQYRFVNSKEISNYLAKVLKEFMRTKIKKVIHASKLRNLNYENMDAGDQFRYYSSANSHYHNMTIDRIPVVEAKLLQIRYPSKLTKNNELRIQEQQKQEELRNEAKKKLQGDKKSDKFLQNYTLDEPKWTKTDRRVDEIRKKVGRLAINEVTVQYMIQDDQWFNDSVLMQRSFYK